MDIISAEFSAQFIRAGLGIVVEVSKVVKHAMIVLPEIVDRGVTW
jgi:hypothetical protein